MNTARLAGWALAATLAAWGLAYVIALAVWTLVYVKRARKVRAHSVLVCSTLLNMLFLTMATYLHVFDIEIITLWSLIVRANTVIALIAIGMDELIAEGESG